MSNSYGDDNHIFSKKMIHIMIGSAIIAFLMLFVVLLVSEHNKSNSDVGIKNPDQIFTEETLNKDDLDELNNSKKELYDSVFVESDRKIEKMLSTGAFQDLDEYLRSVQETYRETDDQSQQFQEERISNIRNDLALLKGIQNNDQVTLGNVFATPDVLAAAMLYLPLTEKYQSFLNLSCIAVPAITEDQSKVLQLKDATPDNSFEMLAEFNERWDDRFVELRVFSAYLNGSEIEVVVLLDGETARWVPYTIRPKDGDYSKYITIQKVKSLADYLMALNALDQLDSMVTYEDESDFYEENPFDEQFMDRKPNC